MRRKRITNRPQAPRTEGLKFWLRGGSTGVGRSAVARSPNRSPDANVREQRIELVGTAKMRQRVATGNVELVGSSRCFLDFWNGRHLAELFRAAPISARAPSLEMH